jgi:hypothetical protein
MRFLPAVTALSLLAGPLAAQAAAGPAAGTADQEVMAVVVRLFDGMRKGDSAMVRSTFDAGARMATAMIRPTGETTYRYDADGVDGFAKAVGTPHDQPWDEKLWDVKVLVDRNLATVWTKYAFFLGPTFSHCGVDTFTLAKGAEGWKIIFLADTRQREGCALPEKYDH